MLLATHAFDIYTQIARQQSDSKANHFDYRHRQKCVTGRIAAPTGRLTISSSSMRLQLTFRIYVGYSRGM